MRRETLFFLLSAAIHAVVLLVVGCTWSRLHRRESVGVVPGVSSLRVVTVRAQPAATLPPPPDAPSPRPASRQAVPEEKRPTPPSSPQNGAITPSRPDALHNAPPPYPEAARARGIEGTAMVLVRVGRDGAAREVTLASSSGSALLDAAAVEAVRLWRFRPASLGGLAVESLVEIPVCFRLNR
ncbi:protein TonB [Verrucomicrobium sp. GAS474]|uniref:energy transducer TonB n=1 Tax=Verrucomicrobium sp. GAS474 TaxID=1882831 RepID=UPI00087D31A9|nr:energy transducer TonB [Verrucomicrobium sp. GAS474]SDT85936.1 protein TonB [Verrucomicrobium sp. GAS474]